MMDALNIPVQVISVCDIDGIITPIRCRFTDADGQMRTIGALVIEDRKEIKYVGIEAFTYVCRANIDGQEQMFELRYAVRLHQWVLFHFIY